MHKSCCSPPSHFQGKDALSHVIEARRKGKTASGEIHGAEMPGHYCAAADAAKETAFLLAVLWTLFSEMNLPLSPLHGFSVAILAGWLFWKVGRSALLGWSRLERLHRVIEEERWEIEHHRPQEKEELKALYAAKGFSGKLLDEVVDVLMADDNRLLQVMLVEELGFSIETHEHPLKQAAGAFFGVVASALCLTLSLFFLPNYGLIACSCLIVALSSALTAKLQKNRLLPSVIWNLAVLALASLVSYFTATLLAIGA